MSSTESLDQTNTPSEENQEEQQEQGHRGQASKDMSQMHNSEDQEDDAKQMMDGDKLNQAISSFSTGNSLDQK